MTKDNLHRLLKRQLKEHALSMEELPENIRQFLTAVNSAYTDFDKDLEHTEHILKESSQELFKKNKELNALNAEQVKIIDEKTANLTSITRNLQNAEKIAELGNFSWDISSGEVELSKHFCEMIGLPEEQSRISTHDLGELFKESEKIAEAIEEAISNNKKVSLSQLSLRYDKSRIFTLEGEVIEEPNRSKFFTAVLQDITEQKKRENALNNTLQELENYKKAIDHSGIISKSDRKGNITYVNKMFQEISGYSESELLGTNHNIVNSGLHDKKYFGNMWNTISSGKIWKGIFRNKKKDGTFYWVDSTIVPFISNGEIQEYISIRFDITEKMLIHQKVEEQKLFYESILNNIPVDIAVFNNKHQYLYVNPISIKNPEVRDFIIGKDDFDYCEKFDKNIDLATQRRELFNKVKTSQKPNEFIDKFKKKDETFAYRLRKFFPVLNGKNELDYMIGFGIDITENVQQSLKIEESLKEKEALLGEIHHRVKNNLALVLGLIEMQIAKSNNDSLRQELSEVQHRISAMSLIHEKLYKTSNFAKIDLSDYLQDLIKFLSGFYGKNKIVKLHFEMEHILASTKKAIPVALIVNELITNCYKYAFKDKASGNIFVFLKKQENQAVLKIRDDGPGLPEGIDLTKLNSLGFKLLNIFTKQLKGNYIVNNDNGLSITLNFKDEQEGFNS
jgi:PAS domain S-box-containing protein